jgi:dTDP-glucose 4,6-dehydratase
MAQLACEIISLTKSSSTVTQLRLPQDDPTMREPDISKAKNLLNWEPHTPREQGLLKTISYFRNELSR